VTSLLAEAVSNSTRGRLANRFIFDLHDALVNLTPLTIRAIVLRSAREILQHLARQDPRNADWQRGLSVGHNKLGDVRTAQGDLIGALLSYRAALAIAERLAQQEPRNADWQRDLSVSHDRIGEVQKDPRNADWQRDIVVSFYRLASLAQQAGRPESGDYWRRCRDVLRNMNAKGMFIDPPLVQLLQQLESAVDA
jgi:hypothetical protein